jgi:hypothetical protein
MLEYDCLTDDELLKLAQEREQLTDEARLAFDGEIARRGIRPDEISAYARQCQAEQRKALRRIDRSARTYETRSTRFLGKKNRRIDSRLRVEEFDTTRWFLIVISIFPIGSYRLRRLYRRWWNPCRSSRLHVVEARPKGLRANPLDLDHYAEIAFSIQHQSSYITYFVGKNPAYQHCPHSPSPGRRKTECLPPFQLSAQLPTRERGSIRHPVATPPRRALHHGNCSG